MATETFVEPQSLASRNGRLDLTLTLAYLNTKLDGKDVNLRNMFGSIPAPTLRVNVGDTLPSHAGELIEIIPFQSTRAGKQTVALGSVEEWTVFNMNFIKHPFHIHVNPCWVVKINDKPIDPYWADTIALPSGTPKVPGSITFRSRFLDFKGA